MLCQGSPRDTWLRLTPEPERVLPRVVAGLRRSTGQAPTAAAVRAEEAALEALILRGRADDWLDYLAEVTRLATDAAQDPGRSRDALTAAEVVRDHHRLLIGISEPLAARVSGERAQVERLAAQLRAADVVASDG